MKNYKIHLRMVERLGETQGINVLWVTSRAPRSFPPKGGKKNPKMGQKGAI
jgi:hypothetical protein